MKLRTVALNISLHGTVSENENRPAMGIFKVKGPRGK